MVVREVIEAIQNAAVPDAVTPAAPTGAPALAFRRTLQVSLDANAKIAIPIPAKKIVIAKHMRNIYF